MTDVPKCPWCGVSGFREDGDYVNWHCGSRQQSGHGRQSVACEEAALTAELARLRARLAEAEEIFEQISRSELALTYKETCWIQKCIKRWREQSVEATDGSSVAREEKRGE